MAKTSDSLLNLIATMSKQEKRYFKLRSTFYNKVEGSSCVQLFELIERTKPSNGKELLAHVQQETYAAQISFVKNQLTEQLLDSLAAYRASHKSWFTLQQMLSHVDVLMDRGLHEHAERLLMRAEKKALQLEEHWWLLEILHRKRSLLIRHVASDFEHEIHAVYARIKETLALILSTTQYRELLDIVQVLAARYAAAPTTHDATILRNIIANPLLSSESKALTFSAKAALHTTRGTNALLVGNTNEALLQYRAATSLWREHPIMIREHPVQYQDCLENYLNCLIESNEEEEFVAVAHEIKKLRSSGGRLPIQLERIWNIELLFSINRGDLEHCASVIREIEQYLATHQEYSNPVDFAALFHNCSVYYFLSGQYSKAVSSINTLQEQNHTGLKRDLQEFARVFSLITHYELGNITILDSMIRSAKRFLKKRNAGGVLERLVLRSVVALISAVDANATQRIFVSLYNSLAQYLHDSDKQQPLGLIELLFWAKSHIENTPISKVFTDTIQQHNSAAPTDMFPLRIATAE